MSDDEEEERICDQCGSPVPPNSPGGMCPKCLAGGVLGNESADDWLNPGPDRTGEIIGGWEILAPLGEGAFGEVYQVAKEEGDQVREGALKILKAGVHSREALARFDAERKALAKLNHPNITRIFDTGETDGGQPWFVMEFVDGEPVTDFCRFRELPIRERVEVFQTICEAVNHAHDQGIVHRDLKPSNILVATGENDEPIVKLIDFGVAKAVNMPLTQKTLFTLSGVLIGTPEYMSPEQASGNSLDLDARADVYSLGVLLYELLTGTTPITSARFREAAFDEVLRLVREVEAIRPSAVGRGGKIVAELDWIALKALDKDRDRRYANSGKLGDDIRCYLEQKPIRARRPGRIYRARKFLTRNRKAAIGVASAAALIVLAATGGWSWSKQKMQQLSPRLTARSFRPAPFPPAPPISEDDVTITKLLDASENISDYPGTVAKLCRTLRDDPDDDNARFRLWAMLTLAPYPERIGDPVTTAASGKITGALLSRARGLALISDDEGKFRAHSSTTGEIVFSHDCGTPIRELCLSKPDEDFAAVAGANGTIFVFDLKAERSHNRFSANRSKITTLAFGYNSDILFSGDEIGNLNAWPVATGGSPVWTHQLKSPARHLSSYPRASDLHLACGREDGQIDVFQATTGKPVGTAMPSIGSLAGIGISYYDDLVIGATRSGEIIRWNYRDGSLVDRRMESEGEISSFALNLRSSYFMTGSGTNQASIRGIKDPNWIRITRTDAPVTAIDINTNRHVATGTANGSLRIWRMKYERYETDVMPAFPGKPIHHLSFTHKPSGLLAATDSLAQQWDFSSRAVFLTRYHDTGYIRHASSIPGTELVRFMGKGGAITCEIDSGELLDRATPIPPGARVTALSGDGFWISAAYGNRVRTWKAPLSGSPIPAREMTFDSPVTALALSEDGLHAAAATANGAGFTWETASGKSVVSLRPNPSDETAATSVTLGHGLMAIGLESGLLRLIELETGAEIDTGPAAFPSPIGTLGISSKGTVAIGFRNGVCRLINPTAGFPSGKPFIDIQHPSGIFDLDFSSDGRWIVCGIHQFSHFWDARDGRYLFRSHQWNGDVPLVEFSHDQHLIFRIGTATPGPTSQQLPPIDDPIPEILLDYAEGYAGFRIDENGNRQPVSYADFTEARKIIGELPEDGSRTRRWVKWAAIALRDRESTKPDR